MINLSAKSTPDGRLAALLSCLLISVFACMPAFGQAELADSGKKGDAESTRAASTDSVASAEAENISGQAFISAERLQEIFSGKVDPQTTDDLRAIEAHVKKLVENTTPATVGLIIGQAAGSGVIITNDGYVLTAGHVSMKANQDAIVILPDGKQLKAKTLGINNSIDSGLIKITDEENLPYLEMGTSSDLEKGQWIIALGHPGGYELNRQPVLRLGRILSSSSRVIRTDCVLIGGDSGGPLINMQGQVIGIHSRINEKVTSNYHVPIDTYGETWDRLVKGETWGGAIALGGVRPYLGFRLKEDSLVISDVTEKGPADKAGLKKQDEIKKFAGRRVTSPASLKTIVFGLTPGEKVDVVVMRGEEEVNLSLEVGARGR